ncbi:helix-turn-helix domain-containing protein [Streptomyces sp. NPDC086554]|uniref:MarR family transcriptional regulator n=1 Tax=Streptomyces sp. NPDC086554 TaxID=3154864 RepID=UPI00341E88D1
MSDTTSDDTRTLHAVPAAELLAHLSGAPAALYTKLVNLAGTDGSTVTELALAAGVGRSTAGKALTALEQRGLAVRTPGGHDGPRRTPDRWRAAPTHTTSNDDGSSDQEPANTPPKPAVTETQEPVGNTTEQESAPADETATDTPATPDDNSTDAAPVPPAEAQQDTEHSNTDNGDTDDDSGGKDGPHDKDGNSDRRDEKTPAPQASTNRQTPPAETITLPGGKKRLVPGALRQMVIDHLQAHPDEAFTATKISRVIEKSSGAIANALVTLARQGIAEHVSERPRTYRLATPEGNS